MIPHTKERNFTDDIVIGGSHPFVLIAGPCVIESLDLLKETASFLKDLCAELKIPFVFKSSFDKANRSSIDSFRGPGLVKGLQFLKEVKEEFNVPILTDIHLPDQAEQVAEVADILQIPAFLCRQTDLILAASRTGKWTNIKKGQFIAPLDAMQIIDKYRSSGNDKVSICERGYTFGYNNLVVDMRGIELLRRENVPVIMDATHSTQLPGGGKVTGGQRDMAYPLARAAAAVGVDGFFMETHPNPPEALSDATNQLYLKKLPSLLKSILSIDALVKGRSVLA